MNLLSPNKTTVFRCGLILLCFLSVYNLSAQIKKGEKLMQQGAYEEAIKPLKKEFYTTDKNTESGLLLAKCFYTLRKYPEALDIMQAIDPATVNDPNDKRFYADVLIANDDFSSAYVVLIALLSDDQSDPKTYLWLDKVSDLLEWDSIPTGTKIERITGLNTIYNDYAPFYTIDGDLIFVSDANTIQAIFPNSYSNQNLHLYYQTKPDTKNSDQVSKPVMLMRKRDYYFHDGPMDNWPNHAKYAFTLRKIGAPDAKLGIYFSTFSGNEDELIPFKYNQEYNTGHPAFYADGTRLIFSSDRPGGYGQMDLWYSDWINNSWTEPINFGPTINTPFNEVFPVFNNERLYFSSDRRDMGYGALDIYYSSALLGYTEIGNLRAPINSAYDDFAPTFQNTKDGYFSSNRTGGTGGDDIYGFVYYPMKVVALTSQLRLENADLPPGTPIEVQDETGKVVLKTTLGASGALMAENLSSGELYTIKIDDPGLNPEAKLAILSTNGAIIGKSIKKNDQEFEFELAPKGLDLSSRNRDYDEMKYDVNGKLITESGDPMGNVPVSLVGPDGEILASTTTNPDGSFKVGGIAPGKEYTIRTEGIKTPHEINVYGKSGAIEQSLKPIGNNRFTYTRDLPPAAWMAATDASITNVITVISGNGLNPQEVITLYDEQDSVITHPEIGKDSRMNLETLKTGKAYRLNFKITELTNDSRLYLLGSKGDTAQTIRPFDAHNYFFEYMLNSDFGGVDYESEPMVDNQNSFDMVHKMKINNYDLGAGVAFVLRQGSNEILDTIYSSNNGVLLLRNLEPNVEYELMASDTTFAVEKSMKIFDAANNMVFEGESKNKSLFIFSILDDQGYSLKKEDNEDDSFLNFSLSGTIVSSRPAADALNIYTPEGKLITEIHTTDQGNFEAERLPRLESYTLKSSNTDPNAMLRLFTGVNSDSLKVKRNADGIFNVNMSDLSQGSVTVQNENNKEVTVNEGFHFKLPEVYYDFNSYYLKADSRKSIDRLYVFLRDNPSVKIEIQSHTDSQGPSNYNMLLSQRRAEGVVKYLSEKGIATDRMRAVGKGETELTNKCKDGVPCTEAEQAANRRTEFVILNTSK